MKEMSFTLKYPVAVEAVIEIEKALTQALESLGYSTERDSISVTQGPFGRYAVYMNGEYFGVWDMHRNTFVD